MRARLITAVLAIGSLGTWWSTAPSLERASERNVAATEVIDIPFRVVRQLFPPDGKAPLRPELRPIYAQNTIYKVIGDSNKWPANADGFERHEAMELAFGYVLRAKNGDRDDRDGGERPWGPGFEVMKDRVHIRGGWRVHKHVGGAQDDYFDGKFEGDLRLAMEGARLRINVEGLSVTWNGSKLGELIDGGIEGLVSKLLQAELNDSIRTKVIEPLEDLVKDTKEIAGLRNATSVSIDGTTVRLTVAVQ